VEVIYDPDNPARALKTSGLWLWPAALGLLAAASLVTMLVMAWRTYRSGEWWGVVLEWFMNWFQ